MAERDQNAIMRRSNAQERRTAKEFAGGKQQPQSGAGWSRKHDVISEKFLIENKTKARDDAQSISLKLVDLMNVVNRAARAARTGLLQFDLGRRSFVVIEKNDFLGLLDRIPED